VCVQHHLIDNHQRDRTKERSQTGARTRLSAPVRNPRRCDAAMTSARSRRALACTTLRNTHRDSSQHERSRDTVSTDARQVVSDEDGWEFPTGAKVQ
jgi:hypothetical protein